MTGSAGDGLAHLVGEIDAGASRLVHEKARYEHVQQRLADFRYSWRDPDGSITVTISGTGKLVGLDLAPRLLNESSAATAGERIKTAILTARGTVNHETQSIWRPLLANNEAGDRVLAQADSHYGELLNSLDEGWDAPSRYRPEDHRGYDEDTEFYDPLAAPPRTTNTRRAAEGNDNSGEFQLFDMDDDAQ